MTRRNCASSELRNIQPSAGAERRVNEALARSRSSGSRTATIAVAGPGRCLACSPLTTSRGLRSRESRLRPTPRVRACGLLSWWKRRTGRQTSTWMPRGTEQIRRSRSSLRLRAHTAGGRSDLGERTPRRSPAGPRTRRAGSGLQFLLSNWVAATSKWGHRPASGDLWIISLPGVSFVDAWGGQERAVGPLVRLGSCSRHQPRRAGTSGDIPHPGPVGVSGPSSRGSTWSPRSRPKGGPAPGVPTSALSRRVLVPDNRPNVRPVEACSPAGIRPFRSASVGPLPLVRPGPARGDAAALDPVGCSVTGRAHFVTVGRLGRCQCCGVAWGHE